MAKRKIKNLTNRSWDQTGRQLSCLRGWESVRTNRKPWCHWQGGLL